MVEVNLIKFITISNRKSRAPLLLIEANWTLAMIPELIALK